MDLKKKIKMEKNIKFSYLLALHIIIIFSIAMFSTFFGETLSEIGFFGDVPCTYNCNGFMADESVDWGARHYWYVWMCFLLFICSILRTVFWVNNYWEEELKSNN